VGGVAGGLRRCGEFERLACGLKGNFKILAVWRIKMCGAWV